MYFPTYKPTLYNPYALVSLPLLGQHCVEGGNGLTACFSTHEIPCQLKLRAGSGKTGKMARRIPCRGKRKEFGNFAKTQGIWFAQVVNSLIVKIKDTVIFAAKIAIPPPKVDRSAMSVLCM